MISPQQFSEFFDKGAKRMNREVLHYRIEVAEPHWPSDADLKAVGEACDRWLAQRKLLRGAWKNHDFLFPKNFPKKDC
jgi:hypothetical protein